MKNGPCDRTDKYQRTSRRLNGKPRQPLLDSASVADEVHNASYNPNQPDHRPASVIQIGRANSRRNEKFRHPFERVHVSAENPLKARIHERDVINGACGDICAACIVTNVRSEAQSRRVRCCGRCVQMTRSGHANFRRGLITLPRAWFCCRDWGGAHQVTSERVERD
jgi:hypothetical protein